MIKTLDNQYIEQLCLEYGLKLDSIFIYTLIFTILYFIFCNSIPLITIKEFKFNIKDLIERLLLAFNSYILLRYFMDKHLDFFINNYKTLLTIGIIIIVIYILIFFIKNKKGLIKLSKKIEDGINEKGD